MRDLYSSSRPESNLRASIRGYARGGDIGIVNALLRAYPTNINLVEVSIYDASMQYQEIGEDLVIIAGKNYGAGSSRDWAAKGTRLLGVKAVIAESFERIHRSNLIGMGVLPLMFRGYNRHSLNLTGNERISLIGIAKIKPGSEVKCLIEYEDGEKKEIHLIVRIDTIPELSNYQNGGILQRVVREVLA